MTTSRAARARQERAAIARLAEAARDETVRAREEFTAVAQGIADRAAVREAELITRIELLEHTAIAALHAMSAAGGRAVHFTEWIAAPWYRRAWWRLSGVRPVWGVRVALEALDAARARRLVAEGVRLGAVAEAKAGPRLPKLEQVPPAPPASVLKA